MALATAESTTDGGAGKLKVFAAEASTTDGAGAAELKAWAGEMNELVASGSTTDDAGAAALKASAGEIQSLAGDVDGNEDELKVSAAEPNTASVAKGSTPDEMGAAVFDVPVGLNIGGSVPVGTDESNVSIAESMAPSDAVVVAGTALCSGEDTTAADALDVDGTVGLSHDVSCVT